MKDGTRMKPRDAYWVAESKAWEQMSWNKTRSILESEFKNCEDVEIRLFAEVLPKTIIQEVLPDTIQISREEFRNALVTFCNTLSFEPIELKLFGPVTPGSR